MHVPLRGQELPAVLLEGEPYFDRNAACQILEINNTSNVMQRLSSKGVHQVEVLTKGGMQLKTFIDERNLYSRTLRDQI
jgi:prophage antirepressor-like protein